jgi:hypothetical protein
MKRRTFIRNAGMAGTMLAVSPVIGNINPDRTDDFPLLDLHVHLTDSFTIDHLMDISKKTGVRFGIVENPGYRVRDNESLKNYIDKLRPYPVYIGLQPMSPGWSANFSQSLISQLDYIIMDAQTIPDGNGYGETLRIWNFYTYIDDA